MNDEEDDDERLCECGHPRRWHGLLTPGATACHEGACDCREFDHTWKPVLR